MRMHTTFMSLILNNPSSCEYTLIWWQRRLPATRGPGMCRTGGRQIWFNYFDALELKNIFWNTAPQAAVSHRLYTSEYQNGSEVASSRWLVPLPFPPKNMIIFPNRPVPIVLVKCWKVAHWNAKKLLKNCQKSKKLLPKFQKLLPKFLAIFI